MSEQRKNIRIDEQLRVTYQVIYPPDGHGGSSSKNISEGGICLPTQQRLQAGMILELSIHITEDANPIVATGEVIWLRDKEESRFPYSMGLKFVKIDPADRDKVFEYIRKKTKSNKNANIGWID